VDGRQEKLLRIDDIVREVASEEVYDISTTDHYVYLPEADVTVSNCDDMATLICAMLMACGNKAALRVVSFTKPPQPSHVFACVETPGGWLPLDPVANRVTADMSRRVVWQQTFPI
jgi:transglutaminase-like putative cysteine protease